MGTPITEVCNKAWELLKAQTDPDVLQQEAAFKQKCSYNAMASDELLTTEKDQGTHEQCFLELKEGRPVPLADDASVACLQQLAVEKKWVALKAGKPEEKKPEEADKPAEEKKPEHAKVVSECQAFIKDLRALRQKISDDSLFQTACEEIAIKKCAPSLRANDPEAPKACLSKNLEDIRSRVIELEVKDTPEDSTSPTRPNEPEAPGAGRPAEPTPPPAEEPPAEAPPTAPVDAPKDTPKYPNIVAACQQFVAGNEAVTKEKRIDPAALQSSCEEIAAERCKEAIADTKEYADKCLDRNKEDRQEGTTTKVGIFDLAKARTVPVGPDVPVVVDTSPDTTPFKRPPIYIQAGLGISPTDSGISVDGHDPALVHKAGPYFRAAAGVLLGEEDLGEGWFYRTNLGVAAQYMNFTTEAGGDFAADYSLWNVGVVASAEFVWQSPYVNVVIAPEMALLFGAWETDGLIATDVPGKDYRTRDARFVADLQLGASIGAEFPAVEDTVPVIPYIKLSWRMHLFLNRAVPASNAPEGRDVVMRPDSPIGDGFAIDAGVRF